jgi:hypothetical protein
MRLNRVRPNVRPAAALLLLGVAAACTDGNPLAPDMKPNPGELTALECRVDVKAGTLRCAQPAPAVSVRSDLVVGGQDIYVKMSSTGTSYDAGTEILSSQVTVQNLLSQTMGTPDGVTVTGVRVMFTTEPTVTSGTGSASVIADGTMPYGNGDVPYYLYNEILTPYEMSAPRTWQFDVDPTVDTFVFRVYVSTDITDPDGPIVNAVWDGDESSVWELAGNWRNGEVPGDSSSVSVLAAGIYAAPFMPELADSAHIANLRVGGGSTLTLNGNTVQVDGNVDAPGQISGGTVWMSGTAAFLSGNVPALQLSGSTFLQAATRTSGAVSVTGTLTVADQALSIQLP